MRSTDSFVESLDVISREEMRKNIGFTKLVDYEGNSYFLFYFGGISKNRKEGKFEGEEEKKTAGEQ